MNQIDLSFADRYEAQLDFITNKWQVPPNFDDFSDDLCDLINNFLEYEFHNSVEIESFDSNIVDFTELRKSLLYPNIITKGSIDRTIREILRLLFIYNSNIEIVDPIMFEINLWKVNLKKIRYGS